VQRVRSRGGSPRADGARAPQGTGPGGLITPEDIRAKTSELVSGVEGQVESARPTLTLVAVGGVLLVVLIAFLLGRRSGKFRSTLVDIRRE
jgi:hypothetical protein